MRRNGCRLSQFFLSALVLIVLIGCSTSANGADVTTYDRIVVQLLHHDADFNPFLDTGVSLHGTGSELPVLAQNVEPVNDWGEVEYVAAMKAGDAFIIKVTYQDGTFPFHDDYAIRVLATSDPLPIAPPDPGLPAIANDASNEDDAAPDPWSGGTPLQIGLNEILVRTFDSDITDVDYFRLVLP